MHVVHADHVCGFVAVESTVMFRFGRLAVLFSSALSDAWWDAWLSFWDRVDESRDPQRQRDLKSQERDVGNHGEGVGGGWAAGVGADAE